MTPLEFAVEYIAHGWSPVPIPYKSKAPLDTGWPNLRITEETAPQWFNGEAQNIGVRLGELSGGLADVDLDSPAAVHTGGYFLPRTLCFGRPSKPRSHWLYQSSLWQTEDKAAIQFKFATGKGKDRKEQMILELRIGGGDKAAQTVFPGSVHETGEAITWDEQETIARADGDDIKQRCARAASAALLAAHFPSKGARHDAGLTLGGFLSRCGFSRPDAELFVEAVTIASGQPREKVKDVRKAARESWDEASRPRGKARGFPILAETFGDDVAKHVAKWLGFSGERSTRANEEDSGKRQPDDDYVPPGDAPDRPFVKKYKNLATFIREYQPISYTLEGILPSNVFYFLTARRSTGKTAFLVAALFAISLGNAEILGVMVKKGRVAYVALENPTDLRMKLEVARFHFGGGISLDELADQVTVIDALLPVAEIVEQLNVAAEELGPFQAVLWDTFQAGFQGEEFNDNAGILKYAQQLRTLTALPGGPSVLVAAHPTKNASEGELIPYGGGSSINEADGNLTLWAEDGSIKLHFNRVRGPEFDPLHFRIEKLSSPDILDDEGRQILLPVLRPVSEQTAEQRQAAKGASDLDLLKSLAEEPGLTERERALKLGVPKTTLHRRLEALVKRKFAERGADDQCRLTPKGRREIFSVV